MTNLKDGLYNKKENGDEALCRLVEDKSVSMDVKKMSKQHFSDVPRDGPGRKAS